MRRCGGEACTRWLSLWVVATRLLHGGIARRLILVLGKVWTPAYVKDGVITRGFRLRWCPQSRADGFDPRAGRQPQFYVNYNAEYYDAVVGVIKKVVLIGVEYLPGPSAKSRIQGPWQFDPVA
jgi:hypothetical protein